LVGNLNERRGPRKGQEDNIKLYPNNGIGRYGLDLLNLGYR
jgi:hypothetical protein